MSALVVVLATISCDKFALFKYLFKHLIIQKESLTNLCHIDNIIFVSRCLSQFSTSIEGAKFCFFSCPWVSQLFWTIYIRNFDQPAGLAL